MKNIQLPTTEEEKLDLIKYLDENMDTTVIDSDDKVSTAFLLDELKKKNAELIKRLQEADKDIKEAQKK